MLQAARKEVDACCEVLPEVAGGPLPGARVFPQSVLSEMRVVNSVVLEVCVSNIPHVIIFIICGGSSRLLDPVRCEGWRNCHRGKYNVTV